METRLVCPTCRGLKSVANFAYPGHVEACPRCDAFGYVGATVGIVNSRENATETRAANDIGRLRQLLNKTRPYRTAISISLAPLSEFCELAIFGMA